MNDEMKRLKEEVEQLKVFCQAVADTHAQGGHLRDILHRKMNKLIYRRSQPWFKDLDVLRVNVIKSLLQVDERIEKLERKLE